MKRMYHQKYKWKTCPDILTFSIEFNSISGRARVAQLVRQLDYLPITNTAWVRARLCKLQKGCTQLAAASDKVYQLLAHGLWFSLGTPASSTTKTGRHDIAEIFLKVALSQKKSNCWYLNYEFIKEVMYMIQHNILSHS